MISLGSVIFFSSARISFPINPIGLTFSISSHSLGRVESAARERIDAAGYSGVDVNGDNVRFLDALRESYGGYAQEVIICGLMSCRGDAYNPAEALGVDEALEFHAWQAGRLAGTGVDLLLAATLPTISEATGLAMALAATAKPYMLSFVVRP